MSGDGRRGAAVLLAAVLLLGCGVGGALGAAAYRDDHAPPPLVAAPTLTGPTEADAAPTLDAAQVAAAVAPGVVAVEVVNGRASNQGSGVVVTADGVVLTTNHVVAGAVTAGSQGLVVRLADGTSSTATIVGRAPAADLAVIKLDDPAPRTAVPLGSSATLAVGQEVVAVGAPLGLAGSASRGIVSALDRPVRTDVVGRGAITVLDAVQTDAAVNPGSSGGALVNLAGQLVGLTVVPPPDADAAAATPEAPPSPGASGFVGVGYAIPVDQVGRVAEQLLATGTAQEAVLGLGLAPPGPDGFGTAGGGARVATVTPGGAAEQAGIRVGDVVTRVDDRVVRDGDSLAAALRAAVPGQEVRIGLAGPDRTVTAVLTARPA